jgi:hypothetical protein
VASAEPKVKGVALREFLSWYAGAHGADAIRSIFTTLPKEARPDLLQDAPNLGLIASGWYSAKAVHAVLDHLTSRLPPAERQRIAREAAQAIMRETLTGVYRALLETFISPDRYARNAQRFFSRFFDQGTMTKTKTAPNTHLTVIREWAAHHPFLCDLVMQMPVPVYGMMGCKDVRVKKLRCISDGDPDCAYDTTWR